MKSKIAIVVVALGMAAFLAAPAEAQRRHHRGGGGWGGGAGVGFIAGALLGGAIASQPRYGYGPGYYYAEPGYAYAPGPTYGPGNAVGYCMQRFKSYDPRSGTYLGYDGLRHPCP